MPLTLENMTYDELIALEAAMAEDEELEELPEQQEDEVAAEADKAEGAEEGEEKEAEVTEEDVEKAEKVQEATFAAAVLLDCASRDEIAQIAESAADIAVLAEAFGPVMEKVVVRLDKKARFNHLQKAAIFKLAAEAKDPKYRKLLTLWKLERQIEAQLAKKYGSKAAKVAREQLKNYTSTGLKKVSSDPKKEVGKGAVASKVAARAVQQSKASFSKK